MSLVLLLVAVGLVGVAVAVAAGRVRGGLPDPAGTGPRTHLPPSPLTAEDLDGLRLSVVVRGYRMDEVDAVLDRLREELADRDARLAARTAPPAPLPAPSGPPSAPAERS